MIARTYIESSLRRLGRLYTRANSQHESLYYAKLATLELCGWIEVSMDDIALRAARRLLGNCAEFQQFRDNTVKRVYGFKYDQHFRPMLINLIGLRGIVDLEHGVNPRLFLPMRGALTDLKPMRDQHAHDYIKGTMVTLDAPSVTLAKFRQIYAGLRDIEGVLRRL